MNINEENIGKLFQQKLKDAEVQPDSALWPAIEQQTRVSSGMSLVAKLALSVMAVAIAVSSYFLVQDFKELNKPDKQVKQLTEVPVQTQNTEPARETIPAPEERDVQKDAPQIESTKNAETVSETTEKQEKKSIQKTAVQSKAVAKKQNKETKSTAGASKQEVAKVSPRPAAALVIKHNENLPPQEAVFAPHLEDFAMEESTMPQEEDIPETAPVEIMELDTGTIRYSADPVICFGEDAVLQVFGGVDYEWSNGEHSSRITVSPVEQSTYWVIVHDSLGRQYKHDFTVSVDKECTAVFIPSAFTPNGDGLNDVFKAEGLGVRDFEMIIFSREGKVLFESHSIDNSWDGTYKGELMAPVTYLYQVKYIDAKGVNHVKKGQVTLIR
jgi:gliding motility-associated-like protein